MCRYAPLCGLSGQLFWVAWLVDPLDGTTNFVEGNPEWAVMVALCREGRPVASWI